MKIYIFSFFEIYCSISLIACEYFLNSTMPFSSFNMTHPLLLLWWKFGTMARQRKPTLVQLRVISQPSIRLNRDQPDRNQSFVASFGIGRSSIMRSFPFSFECSIFPKRVAQRQGTRRHPLSYRVAVSDARRSMHHQNTAWTSIQMRQTPSFFNSTHWPHGRTRCRADASYDPLHHDSCVW